MLAQPSYEVSMELPEGFDTRLAMYLKDPDLPCLRAADYRFACQYLLVSALQAWEGKSNFSRLAEAVELLNRLSDKDTDSFPDLGQPGLTRHDLDEISWKAQAWLEVAEVVVESNPDEPLDDPQTLQSVIRREADYFNFQERTKLEDDRCLADTVSFDFA